MCRGRLYLPSELAGETRIKEDQIDEHDRPERIRQYLKLLEELSIVKKVENGYAYGDLFTALSERARNDPRMLRIAILSHVIKERYSTLRYVFGITQLEPFLHVDSCYYWHALDAEKLIHTTHSTLYHRYQSYYGWSSSWSFQSILSDLMEQGALTEESGYVNGTQTQLDTMLKLKQTTLELNPPIG